MKTYTITQVAEMLNKSYGFIAREIRFGYLKAKGKRNKIITERWLNDYLEGGGNWRNYSNK